jgi:hypothetical protein
MDVNFKKSKIQKYIFKKKDSRQTCIGGEKGRQYSHCVNIKNAINKYQNLNGRILYGNCRHTSGNIHKV